jgi:hypothetical protein
MVTMQDRPNVSELVAAVREFLEQDVMAATEGRVHFHTRVAVNALGMIERELVHRASFAAAEQQRAETLLGHRGDVEVLERELAARIRDGSLDDRFDEVREHIRATVREKLLIANPGYLDDTPAQ